MKTGKTAVRFYLVDALLLGVFSAIAFLVPFKHTAAFWISYAFGVIAILLQAYAYPWAFSAPGAKSKVYGFPTARLSTLYLLAQLVLSLVFMAAGEHVALWLVWLVDLVLLALVLIGFIGTNAAQETVKRQKTAVKKDISAMKAMKSKTAALAASASPETKKALEALNEDFFSSDPVSSEATRELEAKLAVRLEDLSEAAEAGKTEEVNALCRKITAMLKERNQICRMSKG